MDTREQDIPNKPRTRRFRRRGATAVEFALIAAPLFLMVFASIEFGRAMMAIQCLEEAARMGCRTAILGGTTNVEVEDEVADVLAGTGIANYTVDVSPGSLDLVERWEPVTISVSASYAEMSWLPIPMYFGGATYTAACTLPREASTED